MSIYDKSGVGIPEPPDSGALNPLLGSVGAVVAGLNPIAAGLTAVGGLSDMFGGGMDVSKAVSGGTFTTGEFGTGKSQATLIIVVAVVLGLLIIFKGKKI